jgi:hypothetical protein
MLGGFAPPASERFPGRKRFFHARIARSRNHAPRPAAVLTGANLLACNRGRHTALRYPCRASLLFAGQTLQDIDRRGKYLLFRFAATARC